MDGESAHVLVGGLFHGFHKVPELPRRELPVIHWWILCKRPIKAA